MSWDPLTLSTRESDFDYLFSKENGCVFKQRFPLVPPTSCLTTQDG